ncbi:MAG TPA: NAD(P)/FAD-dependent oxidoreductase [Candidatus Omnitrophota bacterium]|nr:NAD(P)/FAD-dependent oxidoreductase [Candidatus Omnitrophota bacterium]HPT07335.1 NAD(P)/FAD-dependent oxidoreductase [Candidatus Omnitrophota bacterium]
MNNRAIIVVGAGPAGLMASIRASECGAVVTLVEKKASCGAKILLSGKGRCNLTNACDLDAFLKRFSGRGEFLRDAFKKFFNEDLMRFFEERGVPLKVERQFRVFPVSDRSATILDVLKTEIEKQKVTVLYKSVVKDILVMHDQAQGVSLENGERLKADAVILATGGISYAFTGSTGDGQRIAEKFGHAIVPLRPGLVALDTIESYPKELEGLTLKNIRITFSTGTKEIVTEVGELMFTAHGISGPLVITESGRVNDFLIDKRRVHAVIDLKPGLTIEQLEARLIREFKANTRMNIRNILKELLPLRLIDTFIHMLKIDSQKQASHVTLEERRKIVQLLKGFTLEIKSTQPIEEAMVTRGGVSLKDINPRTMESRRIKGLYFAGEMIDIDADTGGFNLQAAFSTGYLAGESAAI